MKPKPSVPPRAMHCEHCNDITLDFYAQKIDGKLACYRCVSKLRGTHCVKGKLNEEWEIDYR